MMRIELVTGDDNTVTIQCIKNGDPLPISLAATVRAQYNADEGDVSVGPVTCLNNDPGADWPNGIVAIEFPAALSATLPIGYGNIEIEINTSSKLQTYFHRHVEVVKGSIV